MSRATISKHYARLLARWPLDRLRPEHAFQSVLRARMTAPPVPRTQEANTAQVLVQRANTLDPATEMRSVAALYALLDDGFKNRHPVSDALTRPASAPTYYADLLAEIEASPDRSWFSSLVRKYKNMVRMS